MLHEHVWCVIPLYRFSKPEVSADSVILTLRCRFVKTKYKREP